jgi:hypothetical protein
VSRGESAADSLTEQATCHGAEVAWAVPEKSLATANRAAAAL